MSLIQNIFQVSVSLQTRSSNNTRQSTQSSTSSNAISATNNLPRKWPCTSTSRGCIFPTRLCTSADTVTSSSQIATRCTFTSQSFTKTEKILVEAEIITTLLFVSTAVLARGMRCRVDTTIVWFLKSIRTILPKMWKHWKYSLIIGVIPSENLYRAVIWHV